MTAPSTTLPVPAALPVPAGPPVTVTCPDCARPATVLGRFTLGGVEGHEYLRIRCAGALTLLVAAAEVRTADHRTSGMIDAPISRP